MSPGRARAVGATALEQGKGQRAEGKGKTLLATAFGLGLVLVVKLTVGATLGAHPLLVPQGELDASYYRHFAERVNAGDIWLLSSESFFGRPVPAFFISPLYIYALALFVKVGGSLAAARAIQLVLGTLAVLLMGLTARRWYGMRAAWIAAAIAAACGLFTFYETLILQASLEPILTACDLYALTRAVQDGRRRDWIATGAAFGLHALNRPNMLIVFAGIACVLLVKRRFRPVLLATAALAVVIAPVTLRNYRASGEFVPISSHGGLNFLIGNGPDADGTFVSTAGIEPSIRGQWRDTPQADGSFFRRAIGWIREHPLEEGKLLARKTWYALSDDFIPLNHSFSFFLLEGGWLMQALIVGPALIIPLGLVGLVFARPAHAGYVVWAAFVPFSIASVVVFFVAARYRLPFQVALVVAAGGGVSWAIDQLRLRAWRPLSLAGVAAATVLALVLWPTGLDNGLAEEQVRMGLYELDRGRVTEGEAWITKAGAAHAYPGVVHLRAGQAHESAGRLSEALAHYTKANAIDPGEPTVHRALARVHEQLGLALVTKGEPQRAIDHFATARGLAPKEPSVRLNLAVALAMVGRTGEARAEAEAALALDRDYDRAKELLKRLK